MIIIKIVLLILLGCFTVVTMIIDFILKTVQLILAALDASIDYMRLVPVNMCIALSKFIYKLDKKNTETKSDDKVKAGGK